MAVRIIKNSWWIDFRFNHTRHRIRSPENSRAGALAYETTIRHKLALGQSIGQPAHAAHQNELFHRFAESWFQDYVIANNTYAEQRAKKYILAGSLIPFFGKIPVAEITSHHIEQYKAKMLKEGVTSKTLKNRLTVLNKCLLTAYEWLALEKGPPKIKWPKCPPAQTDHLSPEECEMLLSRATGVVYELILTALRTGMRQGELRGLQWSSIDWQNRILTVRHSRDDYRKMLKPPKSNRERHIPLDVDVYEMLHLRKKATGYVFLDVDKHEFDSERLARRLAALCKLTGFRHIGWHVLRHTFASHLAMRGVPLNTVQTLLGHSNILTTMRYAHVAPSTLRAAIEMLNPKTMLDTHFGQPVGNQWLNLQQREMAQKGLVPK